MGPKGGQTTNPLDRKIQKNCAQLHRGPSPIDLETMLANKTRFLLGAGKNLRVCSILFYDLTMIPLTDPEWSRLSLPCALYHPRVNRVRQLHSQRRNLSLPQLSHPNPSKSFILINASCLDLGPTNRIDPGSDSRSTTSQHSQPPSELRVKEWSVDITPS